ncbi:MAG: aconitate hydratase AcnA [Congregibacter sp.]
MTGTTAKRATFMAGGKEWTYYPLAQVGSEGTLARLPFCLKVLLENLLRNEDGGAVTRSDIEALVNWEPQGSKATEIAFTPARVVLQDFTGVPAIVDLAAMRDAIEKLGGDPGRINPLTPVELVIDHSVQVDSYGQSDSMAVNNAREYERNGERYKLLRWGQQAFEGLKVVPPGTGIVHQVNIEQLARVVFPGNESDAMLAYPDTLVGTDSHTTMVNGLGVLGWGVGGIEAEAAMLGQPVSMLVPKVVGLRLDGALPEGSTATDLVLRVTQLLREHGVVGKFVEFYGDGLADLPVADRATLANMAPEYGATCGIFPIDDATLRYLRLTGRSEEQVALVEAYARAQGLYRLDGEAPASYSETLSLDLSTIEPSLAGPRRPQDRINLRDAAESVSGSLNELREERVARAGRGEEIARFTAEGGGAAVAAPATRQQGAVSTCLNDETFELCDGAVVIAAITSCTNTSNPSVMIAAGLLARNARERGLRVPPWVKTSLAPGSKVVSDYLMRAKLNDDLDALGFHLVGYGCTTCIGNSGPLAEPIADAIRDGDLAVCSVLSGNRNFEGRIHPQVQLNYLASPPLVVAYALSGRMDIDLLADPLGVDADGKPVYLRDLWPSQREIDETVAGCIDSDMFLKSYAGLFDGDEHWRSMDIPDDKRYRWEPDSTHIRLPPFFDGMQVTPAPVEPIAGARVLCLLGDSVTTDHISPAGAMMPDSPAGEYLQENGVAVPDFNSYGSRRGNHEVMLRGTFANVRLRNRLAPGTEGGWTRFQPAGDEMTIFEAAERYAKNQTPLLVIAGKEYGSGSSRDWAAKGPRLLGVRAVIAESYERIHRSNLIGMGILPLEFAEGESAQSLALDGTETYDIQPLEGEPDQLQVDVRTEDGDTTSFVARVRIDTPQEWEYYRHGGILHYVLRNLLE